MATTDLVYTGPTTLACTLGGLASSATWVAGRSSIVVTNASTKFIDVLVQGKLTAGTTPTINTYGRIYVWGTNVSAALDVLDMTDSAKTITSVGVRDGFMRMGAEVFVDATTTDRAYPFGPFSVASLFGANVPQFWGIFVAHNMGAAIHATNGNHVLEYTGIEFASA